MFICLSATRQFYSPTTCAGGLSQLSILEPLVGNQLQPISALLAIANRLVAEYEI
jgi:hypothetical protein